jgi:hypothetical protein
MVLRSLSWLGDNALNALAYVALHVASPVRANDCLVRIARLCPPIRNAEQACAAARRLGKRGSCLSRSMAISARFPGSQVVIGVQSEHKRKASTESGRVIDAHAWVEFEGVPLDEGPSSGSWVELGRLDPRS